jgi:hypothetical protein
MDDCIGNDLGHLCTLAEAECARDVSRGPPPGFERALTALEGVAVYRSDLALRAEHGTLGRVWGVGAQG